WMERIMETPRAGVSRHRPQPPTVLPNHNSNIPSKQLKLSCLDEPLSVFFNHRALMDLDSH
ncbi:hypothetical protein SK128_003019, partial [Halocaridina rubra]